jgi:hypothetical protein
MRTTTVLNGPPPLLSAVYMLCDSTCRQPLLNLLVDSCCYPFPWDSSIGRQGAGVHGEDELWLHPPPPDRVQAAAADLASLMTYPHGHAHKLALASLGAMSAMVRCWRGYLSHRSHIRVQGHRDPIILVGNHVLKVLGK